MSLFYRPYKVLYFARLAALESTPKSHTTAVTNTSDLYYRHKSRGLALLTVGSVSSKAIDLRTVNTNHICSKNDNDPR